MSQARYAHRSVRLGTAIVVLGGRDEQRTFRTAEAYDPSSNTWEDLPSMLSPRIDFAAVTLDGSIYVIGGKTGSDLSSVTASVERYTP
jgi:hypothetical protein